MNTTQPTETSFNKGMHAFTVLTALATLFLIFAGGMVTSTGSGLSVPDWPLSYGMLMPPMVGGVFYEHGHRMIATAVGFLMTIQAIWFFVKVKRSWLKKIAAFAWLLVVTQGVLGGMTVLYNLPPSISVFHAFTAQAFFCLTIAMAVFTSRAWVTGQSRMDGKEGLTIKPILILSVVALFAQLILGAVMRHTGAGLAVLHFPLLSPAGFPELNFYSMIHLSHRYWAIAVALVIAFSAARILWFKGFSGVLARIAVLMLALVVTQVTLGIFTVLTFKAPIIASLHVATGAALLGSTFLGALFAFRTEAPVAHKASAHPAPIASTIPALEVQ